MSWYVDIDTTEAESIILQEQFFPPLPWLSAIDEPFPPKARHQKRKVRRTSLGTAPVTFPLPEIIYEDWSTQDSGLEHKTSVPGSRSYTAYKDPNDGFHSPSQGQISLRRGVSICQSTLATPVCCDPDHQKNCPAKDRPSCRRAACEISPSMNYCKRCEVRLLHINLLRADPASRKEQKGLHDICWTLSSSRAQALDIAEDHLTKLAEHFNHHGYRINGPLKKHSQYDLYLAIDDISTNIIPAEYADMYEVRAYALSNIPSKTKAYCIRNLKRQQARPTYVRSLDCQGKTWVLNYISHAKSTSSSFAAVDLKTTMSTCDWLDIVMYDTAWARDLMNWSKNMDSWQVTRLMNVLYLLRDPLQEVTINQLLYYARSLQFIPDMQKEEAEIRSSSPLNVGLDDDTWSVDADVGAFNFTHNPRAFSTKMAFNEVSSFSSEQQDHAQVRMDFRKPGIDASVNSPDAVSAEAVVEFWDSLCDRLDDRKMIECDGNDDMRYSLHPGCVELTEEWFYPNGRTSSIVADPL